MMLESVITCPHCATAKSETMPTDACRFFYECSGCGAMLRPRQGDCCVFCSFGSVPCPPIQAERSSETGPSSCFAKELLVAGDTVQDLHDRSRSSRTNCWRDISIPRLLIPPAPAWRVVGEALRAI